MSKAKKEPTTMSDADLAAAIDRIVVIRPQANEYSALCKKVKAELNLRGTEFISPAGNKGMIEKKTTYTWIVDALKKCLAPKVFDLLCPRKADATKLNARLAATPEDKKLAACKIVAGFENDLSILGKDEIPTK